MHPHGIDGTWLHGLQLFNFLAELLIVTLKRLFVTLTAYCLAATFHTYTNTFFCKNFTNEYKVLKGKKRFVNTGNLSQKLEIILKKLHLKAAMAICKRKEERKFNNFFIEIFINGIYIYFVIYNLLSVFWLFEGLIWLIYAHFTCY